MTRASKDDLGFTYLVNQSGDLEIRHRGKFATRFSAGKALKYHAQLENSGFKAQQQLMARLTGNYKHGNERAAKNHHRNRRY